MEENNNLPQADVEVVDIQFRPGQKIYFFDPDGVTYVPGDHVIIDTARGAEFGICTAGNHRIPPRDVVAPLRKVIRKANAHDEKTIAENRAREKRAHEVCLQKIADHGLDMQLVSAECAFDGSKILFYFTADERVDFRELVKNLASVFHTRIELRQIGVRDKAKMVGGLGICGRPFCCASFLEDFQPVSIKMAKTQNLSLNPTKISGTCGRLMCCLKYEQDAYEDLIRTSPKMDSFVDTPEGRGTVVEIDLLRQRVKVRMEENPETVSVFANADIAVLRSGKAKKNDPPIPADLAPISGGGKRVRKPEEEDKLTLEPIRFRYSTEAVVEEPAEEESAPEEVSETEESPKSGRSRRRRKSKPSGEPKTEAPKPEQKKEPKEKKEPKREPKEPKEPKEQKEKAPKEGAEGESKPRRRPNHRRRKPKAQGEGQQ
ncbi:MAG: stage 0 sporulation family protein [Oscillospiraceae bacterium]|nr:stage 0 sporulation family protein [Oscillospiraceae bacterium]